MSSRRSITTVLFTDIVGSTERASELGDRGWRHLQQRHHAIVREELKRLQGREISEMGDGFLSLFDNPATAILAAIAIRDRVRELGLDVRCGVHMGEIETEPDGSVGGLSLHIGSRVAGHAQAGEVLVTRGVRDAEAGSEFGFEDRGQHELRGVPGEWRLYALSEFPENLAGWHAEPAPEGELEPPPDLWTRIKGSRLVQAGAIYLLASWLVLQMTDLFIDSLGLPGWAMPAAVILLLIGFVVILATAWVQSRPETKVRAAMGELPRAGAVDVAGLKNAVVRGQTPHLTWGRSLLGGALAFSLLFGLAGLYVVIQDRGESFSPDPALAEGAAPGIAVLPFTVQGEGLDVMREGMVSLLSTGLDGAAGFRTIAPATVFARWREHAVGEEMPELSTALEIARRTGARYALIGSAVSIGSSMRVIADAYQVDTGERLGRARVEGSPDVVLPLVDRLGVEVLRVLLQGQEQLPEIDMAAITTESPEALQAYLEGEVHFRHFDVARARQAYTQAVEIDSLFGLAHYRLSQAHAWAEGEEALQAQHLDRAARLSNRLPKREALLVSAERAQVLGIVDKLDALRQAVRSHPDDGEIWYQLGETQLHVPGAMATAEEVEATFERAVELDPKNARYLAHYTEFAWTIRVDSLEAARRLAIYERATSKESVEARGFRLALDLGFGGEETQADALARLVSEDDDVVLGFALQRTLVGPWYSRGPEVARIRFERSGGRGQPTWQRLVVATHHGRLHELLESAQDSRREPWARAADLYNASGLGFPIPTELLEEALGAVEIETATHPREANFLGMYAADRGRWSDHEAIVAEFQRRSVLAMDMGDSLQGRNWALVAEALRGYGLWKKRGPQAAVPILADSNLFGALWHEQLWVPGRIYQELGRYRDAERVYRTFHHNQPSAEHPLAQRELGKVYEALGEYERALEAYEYFLEYWRYADPELQPMVAEARQAVIRLKGLKRE